jgi:pilus assembly protein CpaF
MNSFELILPHLKPIGHLILDDSIRQVMVNGPGLVFVEKHGLLCEVEGLILANDSLLRTIQEIAQALGENISEANPIMDSLLPDGSHVAAVIPPCSLSGATLTITKRTHRSFAPEDLIAAGTLSPTLAKRLEEYVLGKKNILISGGNGAGKTALLSVLTKFIPDDERIVLIEDRSEIRSTHRNSLRFAPKSICKGRKAVTTRDLLEAAMWHRPDRVIIDTIRDGEAFDLLELMNAGHSGILATIQANSPLQALARLTTSVVRSGVDLSYRAIRTNIADSLNVIVQLERGLGCRYVSEVFQINSYDPDIDLFDYCLVYLRQPQEAVELLRVGDVAQRLERS